MADTEHTKALAPPDERGSLVIADKVVQKIASIAATESAHVADARGGWTDLYRSLPRATAKIAGDRARIKVEVAAFWPSPLPLLTAEVRDSVSSQVTRLTGVSVVAVDVTVAEVVHREAEARRVE